MIGACYVAGALELYRYRQATATLEAAVDGLTTAPSALSDWLQAVHPGLHHAVRLRIKGERVALPAPVLTPYLVGLLVLLGMLGTLLGMMATLKGTGVALQSATDLQAIRGSLAAPVERPWHSHSAPRLPAWRHRPCWACCRHCADASAYRPCSGWI